MSDITLEAGTQIVFADHAGDFGPTAANDLQQGTPTEVQLSLASVASTAARQSAKVDLGANRAPRYSVMAAIEGAATPVTGSRVDFYWNPSPDATAANGNAGLASGADAAYDGGAGTLAEGLAQLEFLGSLVMMALATPNVQVARIGTFVAAERYGSLVVVNNSGAALHSDDVEMHVVLTPIVDDVA